MPTTQTERERARNIIRSQRVRDPEFPSPQVLFPVPVLYVHLCTRAYVQQFSCAQDHMHPRRPAHVN